MVLGTEIDLDFPAMDVLLWQVFGIFDFFTNDTNYTFTIVKHNNCELYS